MTKIIITIILVNIVIMIISGPYNQNFTWNIYLKGSDIKYIFSVNKVAISILETSEMSWFSIPQQNTRVTNIS